MYRNFTKRALDISFSLILLPFVLIVLVPVGIAIKLEDGGPIFYNAPRIGKNKKEFKMFKFRSMKVNAPDIRNADGTTYNAVNDSRVTKVGKFMRKTSIDELPQLINVLVGDMSFVGPRPSPLGDKSMLPFLFYKKFDVQPGITGYNQAYFRNSATIDEIISNDAFYVENVSFIMDLKIIFATAITVALRKNINRNDKVMQEAMIGEAQKTLK